MNQPSPLQNENLHLLTEEFFTPASRRATKLALAGLTGNAEPDLAELLRYHYPYGITNKETWLRDDFDYLLAFYSMLEIAALIGFIEIDFRNRLFRRAERILKFDPIRTYYSQHYRLALPQMFLKRLRGTMQLQETSERGVGIFYNFLPLVKVIEQDPDVETFLWFLDGGWRGRYNYTSLAKTFRKPKKFLRCLTADRKHASHLDRSVQGFVKFIQFCVEFNRLLQDAVELPWLQAEMFAYHSYWFVQCSSKFGEKLYDGITVLNESFGGTGIETAQLDAPEDDRQSFNQDVRIALERLLSGRYMHKLLELGVTW